MSTKIYNGILFKSKNLVQVYEHLHAYRPVIWDARSIAEKRFMADLAVSFIDEHAITGVAPDPDPQVTPTLYAYGCLRDLQREAKKTGQRNPLVDFEFSVVVMPYNGSNYGVVYTEQHDWLTDFMKQPWVREYAYYNNTDIPDGISDRAWRQRGKVWDAILARDPCDRSAGCGLVVEFLGRGGLHIPIAFRGRDLLPFVPSDKQRIARARDFHPRAKFTPAKVTATMLDTGWPRVST